MLFYSSSVCRNLKYVLSRIVKVFPRKYIFFMFTSIVFVPIKCHSNSQKLWVQWEGKHILAHFFLAIVPHPLRATQYFLFGIWASLEQSQPWFSSVCRQTEKLWNCHRELCSCFLMEFSPIHVVFRCKKLRFLWGFFISKYWVVGKVISFIFER